jgi:hypothetical protein
MQQMESLKKFHSPAARFRQYSGTVFSFNLHPLLATCMKAVFKAEQVLLFELNAESSRNPQSQARY